MVMKTQYKPYQTTDLSPFGYYPFGSSIANRTWSDANRQYRYGFNGKEKDFETANDNYDFGARIYDGRLGRWLTVDPETYLYIGFSPFFFSYNNPITYKDIDGKRIYIYYETQATDEDGNLLFNFDPETGIQTAVMKTVRVEYSPGMVVPDDEFVKDAVESLDYMNDSRKGRRQLRRAMNASEEVKIVKTDKSDDWADYYPWWKDTRLKDANVKMAKDAKKFKEKMGFWPSYFTVYWNPNKKLAFQDKNGLLTGKTMSASLCLIHELVHVIGAIKNYVRNIIMSSKSNRKYDNKDEKRTIRIERSICRDLNENIRRNHGGILIDNSDVKDNSDGINENKTKKPDSSMPGTSQ